MSCEIVSWNKEDFKFRNVNEKQLLILSNEYRTANMQIFIVGYRSIKSLLSIRYRTNTDFK